MTRPRLSARGRRGIPAVLAATLLTALGLGLPGLGGSAQAIDQGKGRPGKCQDDTGVTVVVDFGRLGGEPIVRCYPRTMRGTGLDALKGAGFQIAGVQRWGESFICRIENRPSAVETLPIDGNAGYREKCVDTPPAAGYWSYWHAGNNCAWEYSQWGVKNRDFIPGGFEGWSFSLNARSDDNPEPRVAAVRPGTEGGACNAPDRRSPTSNDPDEREPDSPGSPDSTGGASSRPTENSADGDLPAPRPREVTEEKPADPDDDVAFSGGEDAADVNETLQEQSGASPYAPWAAGVVVVILGATMWLTARRRRRARDA